MTYIISMKLDTIMDLLGGWGQLIITVNARNLARNNYNSSISFDLGLDKTWHCRIWTCVNYSTVALNGEKIIIFNLYEIKPYIEMTTKLSLSF
jgi:hypothetical protein